MKQKFWFLMIVAAVSLSIANADQPIQEVTTPVEPLTKMVDFINAQGNTIGHAALTETPHGIRIRADLQGLPPGWHAFHLHAVGNCTPPDFKSAGGHFNPTGHNHGFDVPQGPHAGDLPNIYVAADGKLLLETFAARVTLKEGNASLLDPDGSALVLHAKADDYLSQPAGNAGDRIACAVIH